MKAEHIERAIAWAVAREGRREEKGKPNQGVIVDEALAGLTTHPAAGDARRRPGWAKWCAFFCGQAYRQALLEEPELLRAWLKLFSADCGEWWPRLATAGWTTLRASAAPQRGDLVFYGPRPVDLSHVGLVTGATDLEVQSIEGNVGDAVRRRVNLLTTSRIFGYARPWPASI